ncbi:MAG: SDR family oxidoreductase, partial [Desulfotignum sp.]|nr:SDR family oxidoreductase [Desulfotignum sp.]
MFTDLKDKIALVTGAGKRSGIGYAICRKLAECGCHIVIADLGRAEPCAGEVKTGALDEMKQIAKDLETEWKIQTLCTPLDVTDNTTVSRMAETVRQAFGRVDILCNNAGATFGVPNGIHTYDETAWLRTLDVNLNGVFRVCKAIIPLMQPAGGRIINTASRA